MNARRRSTVHQSNKHPCSKSNKKFYMKGGRGGDRWLADKGFLVQHILDNRGWGDQIRNTKLEGKKQFSEEEDIHNRRTSQARGHI